MFVTAALVVSACGGPDVTDSASGVSADSTTLTDKAADIEAVLLAVANGDQLDFNSLRGHDVLLWFWAPWCTTCQREAAAVAEVQGIYGSDVIFVGVAGRDGLDPINRFIDKYDVGAFDHIFDETGEIWDNFDIVTQPSFVFIDANGESSSHLGALGVDRLSERLDSLTSN